MSATTLHKRNLTTKFYRWKLAQKKTTIDRPKSKKFRKNKQFQSKTTDISTLNRLPRTRHTRIICLPFHISFWFINTASQRRYQFLALLYFRFMSTRMVYNTLTMVLYMGRNWKVFVEYWIFMQFTGCKFDLFWQRGVLRSRNQEYIEFYAIYMVQLWSFLAKRKF